MQRNANQVTWLSANSTQFNSIVWSEEYRLISIYGVFSINSSAFRSIWHVEDCFEGLWECSSKFAGHHLQQLKWNLRYMQPQNVSIPVQSFSKFPAFSMTCKIITSPAGWFSRFNWCFSFCYPKSISWIAYFVELAAKFHAVLWWLWFAFSSFSFRFVRLCTWRALNMNIIMNRCDVILKTGLQPHQHDIASWNASDFIIERRPISSPHNNLYLICFY